ncbi:MAG TPA: hypothetical protein VD833_16095 [Vicinamibacterales bacterium]|nr:hypothetical protein [Vicinamibacterales bacterium]
MYQDILRSTAGIEMFPIFSLLLFVTLFAIVVIAVLRMDRSRVATLARLPLEIDEETPEGADRASGRRRSPGSGRKS